MFVNFVWHFHQPIYRQPVTEKFILPWVNFHTTKNYWPMLKLIEESEFPCTINLVPCLLEQIKDYQSQQARDPVLDSLIKPARELSEEEISRLKRFFPKETAEVSPAKLQENVLQSFFSPLLSPEKKDKKELLELRQQIFSDLFSYFQRLSHKKILELTISPYFHPLLPLIIDLGQARSEAPELPDFKYGQDARWQLLEAREYFRQLFDFVPAGLWPSEGALSQAACEEIALAGFALTFTDEHLLWKSLKTDPQPGLLYQPYGCGGTTILFRDRELSDLISFEYHRWPAEAAASDLLRRLEARAKMAGEKAICSIILDGENPWGAYSNNGIDFLQLIYNKIKDSQLLQPCLPSGYLAEHSAKRSLNLPAGSWMSGFFKWVGHPAKVKAWKLLSEFRKKYGFSRPMAVAEGSDWFWWAGETQEKEFEALFVSYLQLAREKSGKNE
ncbi:MAG: glycoside hydrolase family 57 protein [Acidobacteriota bacterium]|nr:glycoside hydrolase family 57 protein [Acidobacteriota bacterium]